MSQAIFLTVSTGRRAWRDACKVALLALSLAATAGAQTLGRPVRLCMVESAPLAAHHWLALGLPLPRWRQLDVLLTQLLARKAAVKVEAEVLPWRRCLTEVQEGRMDGVLGLSYSPERARWAAFPLRDGQPDHQLRVRADAYHWYVRAKETWIWDSQKLQGPAANPPRVAAVAGYSVVDVLQSRGVRVADQVQGVSSALRMLALGRVDAAALLRLEVDPLLGQEPKLREALTRLDPPLLERAYHLAFGQAFARAESEAVNKLWRGLPHVRELASWKRAELDAQTPANP